jgi:hypothetical protein
MDGMRTVRLRLAFAGAAAVALAASATAERWPLGDGSSPDRVGNNCYEFQSYGGGDPYYHDGVDCLGSGGDPCYAVADGYLVVKTMNEPYYSGIVANYTLGPDNGWLYWHLTFDTIPFVEGDAIHAGDTVGNIATWPTSNFHHVHFTRSYYPGVGQWYNAVDNPIEFLLPATDTQAPTFENAETGQLFSFCVDNTETRVNPAAVAGQVDVIAHVSDKITDTTWEVVPYELSWWVAGAGGQIPLTTFLTFTGGTPPDATVTAVVYKRAGLWQTQGDYTAREYYFIVTNTDGDAVVETGDDDHCLDTTTLPDGPYQFYVRAKDWAGNVVERSMAFTIANAGAGIRVTSFTARGRRDGVELSWAAEDDGGVSYNLYRRGSAPAGPAATASLGEPVNAAPVTGRSPYRYLDAGAARGERYEYWLEAVAPTGVTTTYGPATGGLGVALPETFALRAAAPNPSRGAVTFAFELPTPARAKLEVFDLAGRRVATVVDAPLAAGVYHYPTTLDVAPGVYLYRLRAGDYAASKKLVVAR